MSSQRGNVARTRPQRHQNAFSFKNDKFDTSVQTKRINAKLHDGVCQHCKEVLEWRVKYSKYKPLSKPKKWISSNKLEKTADVESDEISHCRRRNRRFEEEQSDDELDFDLDLNESEDEEQSNHSSYTKNKSPSAKI
ncbi:uncharacterized protein C9orf85 homolog isoform X2 [Vombatus ursinus]|uniref:uncharacterized protein C9orf85 homolog isoform X2 n=1 Tax=Vombatus ursinus TaxID=29139 RepID=UPI000FFD46B0|nr:uncharacterized protein C9orf85 homolog isoform X2 [Vombatus ursinus]